MRVGPTDGYRRGGPSALALSTDWVVGLIAMPRSQNKTLLGGM